MNKSNGLDLFVFHRDTDLDAASLEGGAKGIVIDFETSGKADRQQGFDTQINQHNWQDLGDIKQNLQAYVICRINGINDQTESEVVKAIELGADEILIPMVRTVNEVTSILDLVKEKAQVSVMIETNEAVNITRQLDQLPLARAYVGLNDLRICRGSKSIFTAIADGTVESIRGMVKHTAFGFGGLTIPGCGTPLPVELFLHEMTRLDCQFTFLRRSFFQDTAGKNIQNELHNISSAIQSSINRNKQSTQQGKMDLKAQLDLILNIAP